MTDSTAFGEWLRACRQSAVLSQEELSERSGLSVRTIRNLERGRIECPRAGSLQRLADALALQGQARAEFFTVAGRRHPYAVTGTTMPEELARQAAIRPIVPRQLPASVPQFAGRRSEMAALTSLLGHTDASMPAALVISAIGGTAGVGKTALAVFWAHQVAARFPDGQLYVNLRGFAPSGSPMSPTEAIGCLLDAVGVPAERIPVGLDAQAGLYRSLLAGKRMLVVLDNARDAAQVRPLLPGSPGCLVIITSRSELAGLAAAEGACLLTLDVLTHAEARQMLAARLGADRTAADSDAITEVAGLCARLPLALAIVAARGAARPRLPLAVLAAELRDTARRLDALDAGDPAASTRAAFSWSYQQLSPAAARMFRLLGVHPGPDISLLAAASMAGVPVTQAQAALGELAAGYLVWEQPAGRFAFHDLLRAYAAEQCQTTDTAAERRAAIHRVLDHYLHTSYAAATRCPTMFALPPPAAQPPGPGVISGELANRSQALAWFRAEHKALIAAIARAVDGFDGHAMRLPLVLRPFLYRGGYWHDAVTTGATALAAAVRLADTEGQAYAYCHLGCTYTKLDACQEADTHLRRALALYQLLDNPRGQGFVHAGLGRMFEHQHRPAEALHHAEKALEQFRLADDRRGEAGALNNVGWYHLMLGNARTALRVLRHAADLHSNLGKTIGLAYTLDSLGYAHHRLGQHRQAITCYRRAQALAQDFADLPVQATILEHLGDAYLAAGDPGAARQAWELALDILTDLNHRDADDLRAKLASTTEATQQHSSASSPPLGLPGPPTPSARVAGT